MLQGQDHPLTDCVIFALGQVAGLAVRVSHRGEEVPDELNTEVHKIKDELLAAIDKHVGRPAPQPINAVQLRRGIYTAMGEVMDAATRIHTDDTAPKDHLSSTMRNTAEALGTEILELAAGGTADRG